MSAPTTDGGSLLANLVLFGRILRGLGFDVTPDHAVALARAFPLLQADDRSQWRDAARAILVHRHEHLLLFDRVFDLFWRRHGVDVRSRHRLGALRRPSSREAGSTQLLGVAPPDHGEIEDPSEEGFERQIQTWSPGEVLRRKDFAELTPDEERQVRDLIQELPLRLPPRRSRRLRVAPSGPFFDLRRTLRRSVRFAGDPIELARRQRKEKPRPLVVLCDISASMEIYSRILLQFIYALGRSSTQLEAFTFGTRLTRISRQLRGRQLDRALRDAVGEVVDWGGGTRIGESLKTFNYRWGRRVLGRRAAVILISDGWDCGDTGVLQREMGRLHRSCERLIWLNPLLGSPGYEPLTRGMRAALPFVDHFRPVHNLQSLEQLADLLLRLEGPRLPRPRREACLA